MSPQKAFAYFCTYALAKCQFDGSLSILKSWDDLVMCGPDSKLLNENSVDLAEFCLFLALQHANGPGKIPFLANERHPSLTDLTNGVDDSPAGPGFDNFNETSFWNGRGSFDFTSSHRPLNVAHSEPVSRRRRSHSMDAGCSLFGDASATGHTDASLRKMAAVTEFLRKNARELVEICAVVAQNKQLFDGDKENLDYSAFVVSKKPDIVSVDDLRPMDIIFEGCHAENFNDSLPQTETHVKKFSELVSFVVEKTGDPDQIPVLEVVQLLNIALQQSPYNHGDSDPRLSSQRPLLVCSPLKLRLQLRPKLSRSRCAVANRRIVKMQRFNRFSALRSGPQLDGSNLHVIDCAHSLIAVPVWFEGVTEQLSFVGASLRHLRTWHNWRQPLDWTLPKSKGCELPPPVAEPRLAVQQPEHVVPCVMPTDNAWKRQRVIENLPDDYVKCVRWRMCAADELMAEVKCSERHAAALSDLFERWLKLTGCERHVQHMISGQKTR